MGRNYRLIILIILLLGGGVGCELPFGNQEEVATAEPPPSPDIEVSQVPQTAPADPTQLPEPTLPPEPTLTTTSAAEAAVFETGSCLFDVPADADVTCGTVTLPQNRQPSGGDQIVELAVAVFHSEATNPAAEPVVYLSGGPGGYALELIPFTFESDIKPFLADRDYIIFDQRGTGFSRPSLACPETFDLDLELLDDNLSQEAYGDQYLEALSRCRLRLINSNIDLAAFNSAENAADVEALRLALGYEQWHLFGVSYGTRLAQTIMRDFPEGIASVILDSPYPLEVDLQEAIPGHVTRAFRVFFDGCAADAACQAAYPQLEITFYGLVDRLNGDPVEFPIVYFFTGEEYDVVFNGDDLIDILFQSLYSNEIFPLLPRVINEVENGTTDTLGLIFSTFLINGEFISTGMYRSVQCHEELAFSDLAAVAAASEADPQLADYFANWDLSYEACDLWANGSASPIENQPVKSAIPTLVLTGEYDPITPPVWGEMVAENLSNETLLLFPGIGHGAVSSADCPRIIALAFLRNQQVNDVTACIVDMIPPPFDAPPLEGQAVSDEIALVPFEVELVEGQTLTGVRPAEWEENGPGIYLRGRDLIDQAAVIFQTVPFDIASPEDYVTFFFDRVGANFDPAEEPERFNDAQDREWSIYEADVASAPIMIGVTVESGDVLAVVMVANANDGAQLREKVFEPGLDAIVVK